MLARSGTERAVTAELRRVTGRVCLLVRRARRDWSAIEPLRMMQRLLVVRLMTQSGRHGLRTAGGMLVTTDTDAVEALYTDLQRGANPGGLYIRVNVEAHRWRYVGRTGDFRQRDAQHLRAEAGGGKAGAELESYYYDFVRKHGGAGTWIDVPARAGVGLTEGSLHRAEKQMIRLGGNLNVAGRRKAAASKRTGKKPRRRPVRSLRGLKEGKCAPVRAAQTVVYTCVGSTTKFV